MPKLKTLDLFQNKIKKIDASIFELIPLLENLSLKCGTLMQLENGTFDHLKHLTSMSFSLTSCVDQCVIDNREEAEKLMSKMYAVCSSATIESE
jgi:hypothetical protein